MTKEEWWALKPGAVIRAPLTGNVYVIGEATDLRGYAIRKLDGSDSEAHWVAWGPLAYEVVSGAGGDNV